MRIAATTATVVAAALGVPAVSAQSPACATRHQPFIEGGVAQGHMSVAGNGEACAFSFKFGGNFTPSDWKIEQAPRDGHLEAANDTVSYTPDAGYAGQDEFTVAVFGFNPMLGHGRRARDGRFHISVDVRSSVPPRPPAPAG